MLVRTPRRGASRLRTRRSGAHSRAGFRGLGGRRRQPSAWGHLSVSDASLAPPSPSWMDTAKSPPSPTRPPPRAAPVSRQRHLTLHPRPAAPRPRPCRHPTEARVCRGGHEAPGRAPGGFPAAPAAGLRGEAGHHVPGSTSPAHPAAPATPPTPSRPRAATPEMTSPRSPGPRRGGGRMPSTPASRRPSGSGTPSSLRRTALNLSTVNTQQQVDVLPKGAHAGARPRTRTRGPSTPEHTRAPPGSLKSHLYWELGCIHAFPLGRQKWFPSL